MNSPKPVQAQLTTTAGMFGAIMIVGAVLLVPLTGVFGLIGLMGMGLKKLVWRFKENE